MNNGSGRPVNSVKCLGCLQGTSGTAIFVPYSLLAIRDFYFWENTMNLEEEMKVV